MGCGNVGCVSRSVFNGDSAAAGIRKCYYSNDWLQRHGFCDFVQRTADTEIKRRKGPGIQTVSEDRHNNEKHEKASGFSGCFLRLILQKWKFCAKDDPSLAGSRKCPGGWPEIPAAAPGR